jgi:Flp pilus assembly protein TadD
MAQGTLVALEIDTESLSKRVSDSVMLVLSEKKAGSSLGTGFIVDENGLLITNYHVIEGSENLSVKSNTGGRYTVITILAKDKKRDIAVLKLDAKNLTPIELADSDLVNQGIPVAVLGNPEGYEGTLSTGIVSAIRTLEPYGKVIQVTAPISPGSSGSPIFNKDAQVVAIATFGEIEGQALNFGIPANAIKQVLSEAKTVQEKSSTDEKDMQGIYTPDKSAKGSKEEDSALLTDPRFTKLKTLERDHEYFPMLSLAKKIVEDYPNSALAHRALCDAYYYTDLQEDSMRIAKKAIDLDPSNARGWNNLAYLYTYFEDYDSAIDTYIYAIKLAPDDIKLLIEYADMVSSSNSAAAKSALRHAKNQLLSGSKQDAEIEQYDLHVDIVYSYLSMRANNDAYETAKILRKRFPEDANLWLASAEASRRNKRYAEVYPAVMKASELDKDTAAKANQIFGDSEFDQGKIFSAERAYLKAYSIEPSSIRTLEGLIDCVLSKNYLADPDFEKLAKYVDEITYIDKERGDKMDKWVRDQLSKR